MIWLKIKTPNFFPTPNCQITFNNFIPCNFDRFLKVWILCLLTPNKPLFPKLNSCLGKFSQLFHIIQGSENDFCCHSKDLLFLKACLGLEIVNGPEVCFKLVLGVVSHAGPHLGLLAAAHELLDLDPLGAQNTALQHLNRQSLSSLK